MKTEEQCKELFVKFLIAGAKAHNENKRDADFILGIGAGYGLALGLNYQRVLLEVRRAKRQARYGTIEPTGQSLTKAL